MKEMNLRDELNDSQLQAVEYCDGPSLVIAGAGSGKTRVLTYKIAYLMQQGLRPYNILALTFTNKAAREMRSRIGKLVDEGLAAQLWMGTFHSIFARILRIESQYIGFESNFTIYDETDSKSLIKRIIKELDLSDKEYKVGNVQNRISEAKNKLVLPSDYENDRYIRLRDESSKMPMLSEIYRNYWDRCRQANAMDFDDLLINTYYLFRNLPEIKAKWAGRFEFVLVDEYQDTNYAQHEIIKQLTLERQKVCVVGDDAQSIYSFRGANIDNILGFTKSYAGARTFKLERNYRSTKRIVAAANSLIKHNEKQIHKDVYSEESEGDRIILKHTYSDREEAIVVCKEIQRIRRMEHAAYDDFAILYRTNAQSRTFEEAMRKENIPYRIYGGMSFYQRKEIKDVMAYFRLIVNLADEEAFKRIVNYPGRGIGDTTVTKIITCAQQHKVSLWEVADNPQYYSLDVNKGVVTRLEGFTSIIKSFVERLATVDAYELGKDIIIRSGIRDDLYASHEVEDVARQENLEELLNSLMDFVQSRREEGNVNQISLSHFVQEVALLTDADPSPGSTAAEELQPKVSLMTIHSAKGLEFPTVFIVGVEENIFPSPMCVGSLRALEEERRLFYVAITRAMRHCYITTAQNRWRFGQLEFDTPSRFIHDIDKAYLQDDSGKSSVAQETSATSQASRHFVSTDKKVSTFSGSRLVHIPRSGSVQPSKSQSSSNTQIAVPKIGATIEHERFGIGKVIAIDGEGENTKATVEFQNTGRKQLLLKFARIKIVQ